MTVELRSLTKSFAGFKAVNDLNLSIKSGSFAAILGPSGCGKTTTLRLLAGFEQPTSGSIYINGNDVNGLPSRKRNLGIVFQNYALFPHMTVFQNVAYGLRMQGCARKEIEQRVHEALDLVQLANLGGRRPSELSGGQQQRVALARSIVLAPDLLLFDEPLSNLDAKLRDVMRTEIRRIHQNLGITTVFVTHDQDEALSMADTVVVMNQGSVEQIGSPSEVYWRPATRFVAEFIGASNWLQGIIEKAEDRYLHIKCGNAILMAARATQSNALLGSEGHLLVRPEDMTLYADTDSFANTELGFNCLEGKIKEVVFLGANSEYRIALADPADQVLSIRMHARSGREFSVGQRVRMCWDPKDSSIFQHEAML